VTDACVTVEHQCCCVAMAAVENMLVGLCAGISIHCMATGDLTVNLLACLDKRQGSRIP